MYAKAQKSKGNKRKAAANSVSPKQRSGENTFQFVDNRTDAVAHRRIQTQIREHSVSRPLQRIPTQGVVQTLKPREMKADAMGHNALQRQAVQSRSHPSSALTVQRFPWGKSIGAPGLSIGLGLLGNAAAPGIGGYVGATAGAVLGGLAGQGLSDRVC